MIIKTKNPRLFFVSYTHTPRLRGQEPLIYCFRLHVSNLIPTGSLRGFVSAKRWFVRTPSVTLILATSPRRRRPRLTPSYASVPLTCWEMNFPEGSRLLGFYLWTRRWSSWETPKQIPRASGIPVTSVTFDNRQCRYRRRLRLSAYDILSR